MQDVIKWKHPLCMSSSGLAGSHGSEVFGIISFTIEKLPQITHLGHSICSMGWKLGPRVIQDYELIVQHKGDCHIYINNLYYHLTPGKAILIQPNETHTFLCKEKQCHFYYAHFVPEAESVEEEANIANSVLQLKKKVNTQDHFCLIPDICLGNVYIQRFQDLDSSAEEIFAVFDKALAQRDTFTLLSKISIEVLLCEIFILMSLSAAHMLGIDISIPTYSKINRSIRDITRFIQENYSKMFSVKTLALQFHLTPQYLNRLFKREFGYPIVQYINRYRLSVAKKLIRESNLSMKEICFAIGFETPHYFSKVFKKVEGISPTDFKNMLDSQSNE